MNLMKFDFIYGALICRCFQTISTGNNSSVGINFYVKDLLRSSGTVALSWTRNLSLQLACARVQQIRKWELGPNSWRNRS